MRLNLNRPQADRTGSRKRNIRRVACWAAASAVLLGIHPAAAAINTCSTLNQTSQLTGVLSFTQGISVLLAVGDVVSMEVTATGGNVVSLSVGNASATGNAPTTISATSGVAGQTTVRATVASNGTLITSGTVRLSCSPGGSTDGGAAPAAQTSANAQAAVTFGQITVQNYADRIAKAVMGSFGLMAGGPPASAATSARARLDELIRTERAQADELGELQSKGAASLAAGDPARIATLEQTLAATRRNLALAREAAPARTYGGFGQQPDAASARGSAGRQGQAQIGAPQAATAPSVVKFDAQDLIGFCAAGDDPQSACDGFGAKWNAWTEARVIGGSDSLTRARALGFIASGGVDYKVLPWLATGLTLGVENFGSQFGTAGVGLNTLGFSAVPYLGFRLSESIYASAFAGVSTINYNTTPAVGVSAAFNATRLFLGGSVIGNWHYGAWRFQPALTGTVGTEMQNGYVDSIGNEVSSQSASFGRILLGPEIGYGITSVEYGWALEPFVLARIGVDFASNTVAVTNGQSVIVRPGTQGFGGLGGGVAMQLQNGGYMRAQASYDSIGVSGLNLWSAVLRAGIAF